MDIQVKSSNGITVLPLETRLMVNRRIFLEGEINEEMAGRFVKQIMALNDESTEPIHMFMNSAGGEINSGILIYDTILSSDGESCVVMELAETVWFGLRRKEFALNSRSSDKRARKAACGRIVGPADVRRMSGKTRTGSGAAVTEKLQRSRKKITEGR